jgi:hypothetical protein
MYLTRGIFDEHLNGRFWLIDEHSEPYAMDLIEVADGHSTRRQEQFSLHFRGDREKIYPQRIYAMKHDSIGEFELFLVPIGRDNSGTLYEAVFNRLIAAAAKPVQQDQGEAQLL